MESGVSGRHVHLSDGCRVKSSTDAEKVPPRLAGALLGRVKRFLESRGGLLVLASAWQTEVRATISAHPKFHEIRSSEIANLWAPQENV